MESNHRSFEKELQASVENLDYVSKEAYDEIKALLKFYYDKGRRDLELEQAKFMARFNYE